MSRNLERKQTSRIETFSDAIFAFAITLLVLNLKVPVLSVVGSLLQMLLSTWPSFLALITSFITILIMWINHHNMFNYIVKADTILMVLNGMVLLFIVMTPFTTALVATYILTPNSSIVAAIYSGDFLLTSISWNMFWQYLSKHRRLLAPHITDKHISKILRQYYIGPVLYAAAFALAYVNGIASVIMVFIVAIFYAVTASAVKTF